MTVADERLDISERLRAPRLSAFGQLRLCDGVHETPVVGKPARVLAGLLWRRDGLALDQLIDVVWPDAAPKSARAALHIHLGTVRKLLMNAPPGAAISRSGAIYRLELDGWAVDIDLVEVLTDTAHRMLPTDPMGASEMFQRALSIWTGPPLVVDAQPVSHAITSRYEIARLDLEEARVDALIAAGRSTDAERFSIEMTEAEPYRERRWTQLMRSRAEQGRIADALATFSTARRRLIDDLGVEPGSELQALERSILTRELSSIEVPEALDNPPPLLGSLVGRGRLLERVEAALAGGAPVVMLGSPGVGKTRLAAEIARRAAENRQQVGWVDLRNARFEDPGMRRRVLTWARTWPSGLVVLDNAEQAIELVQEIVDTVRRSAPGVNIVMTSRVPVDTDCAVMILNPLALPATDDPDEIEEAASVRLLRSMLGLLAPNTAVPPALAAELCRQTGGLPLAIRLTADLARTVPLAEVAHRVSAHLASEMEASVAAMLDHLTDQDRTAFSDLSVVAGALDTRLIGALTGREPGEAIDALTHYGLLHYDSTTAEAPYSIPEPLRDAAAARLSGAARRIPLDRLADHCIALAEESARPAATTSDGNQLRGDLVRQLRWHRQAMAHLTDIRDDQRALELAGRLELTLYGLGWWTVNTELQDAALAIPGSPSRARARVHSARGRPGLLHQFDDDHILAAIAISNQVGDMSGCAKATYQLGVHRWWQGEWSEAIDLHDRAHHLAEQCNNRFVTVESLRYKGVALVSAGEFERGFDVQLQVLRQAEHGHGGEMLIPHIRMYLGHSRRHVGDDDAATTDLEQACAEFERIGNRASLIHVCAGLAELHADHGRHDQALGHAARALELSASGGITTYDPWVFSTIARVHAANGDLDRARAAADAAAVALATNWEGEIHRVAAELASVSVQLGEIGVAARLIGVADARDDRRELPFQSPAERARIDAARSAARTGLGDDFDRLHRLGATSTVSEALAPLLVNRR